MMRMVFCPTNVINIYGSFADSIFDSKTVT